jgi:hypothetical protein
MRVQERKNTPLERLCSHTCLFVKTHMVRETRVSVNFFLMWDWGLN